MAGDVVNSNGMNRNHEKITAGSNDDVFHVEEDDDDNDDGDDDDDDDDGVDDDQHFNMTVELLTYQRFCQCRRQFINRRIDDNQLISLLIDHFLACQGSRHLLAGSGDQALDAPSSESPLSVVGFLKGSASTSEGSKDKSGSGTQIQKELNGFARATNNHSRAASNSESSCCSAWDEDLKCTNVAQTYFPLLCQICGAFCVSEVHFKQHVSEHVTSTLYPFQCLQCTHKFTNQCALEAHCLTTHNTSAPPMLPTSLTLDERRFECETCGARFKQQRVLQQHMDGMHAEEQRYNCPCGQRFRWPAKFYQHKRVCVLGKKIQNEAHEMETCEAAQEEKNTQDNSTEQHNSRRLRCDTSPRECAEGVPAAAVTATGLEPILDLRVDSSKEAAASADAAVDKVVLPKADGEEAEAVVEEEMIVAPSSPVLSPSSTLLLCPECGAATESLSELDDHIDSEHANTGTFACLCGQTWDWKPQYLRHLLQCEHVLQHSTWRADSDNAEDNDGETDVEMKEAPVDAVDLVNRDVPKLDTSPGEHGLSGKTRSATKPRFRINYDNQEKPYECVECQKCFRTKTLLDQHGHLHMPPKYQCRYCAKRYRWPPVFYSHQRSCKYQFMGTNGRGTPTSTATAAASHLPTALLMAGVLPPGAKEPTEEAIDFVTATESIEQHQSAQPQPVQQSSKIRLPLSYSDYVCACGGKFQSYRSYTAHMAECPAVAGPAAAAAAAAVGFIGQSSAPGNALVAAVTAAELNASQSFSGGLDVGDKQERHVCPQCGKTYSSKFSLKQHIDGMHSAEGKFECPTCKKRFRWGASYYYHKKACGGGGLLG